MQNVWGKIRSQLSYKRKKPNKIIYNIYPDIKLQISDLNSGHKEGEKKQCQILILVLIFLMIKNVVDHRKRECKNTCEL